MKKEQRVWLMGVPSHGQEVIKALQKLGGENVYGLDGEGEDSIYFINHEGIISSTKKNETGRLIMDFYQKIEPAKWEEGDILVKNGYAIYCVYKHADNEVIGAFSFFFITSHFGISYGGLERVVDYHLASKEERRSFYAFLHKVVGDWDAKNKTLIKWRWNPFQLYEGYYFISAAGEVKEGIFYENDENLVQLCNFGNCFKTRGEAETKAKQIREILK